MSHGSSNARPQSRLRIILAPSAYYPHVGGIEELTRQLALAFESRGHAVSVLTNQWPDGLARQETLDGVKVMRLRFPLPATRPAAALQFLTIAPLATVALVRQLWRARPDVIHIIGAGPQAVYVAAFAPLLRTRIIFTAQGELTFDSQDVFRHSMILRLGLRRVLRVADAVTACSTYVLESLPLPQMPRPPRLVIPNGVNPIDFVQASVRSDAPAYVAAVGRLVPQKGFDVLIRALAQPRLSSLQLRLAGAGPEHDRLKQLADGLGVGDRVQFIGQMDRSGVVELLAGASAFALPSRAEPFGIALLEAMAAGVPCVATRAGGVTEFARDRENALLVETDDVNSTAAALERLFSDAALRSTLSENGLRTASRLSWTSLATQYEQLYLQTRAIS
jgi:glycosyltransferase involved in cell wall biosynthesis